MNITEACDLLRKELYHSGYVYGFFWMIYNKLKHKVHAILTFYLEDQAAYLELPPQSGKQCYGKEVLYENEQDFINDYQNNEYEIVDITAKVTPGISLDYQFVLDFQKMPTPLTSHKEILNIFHNAQASYLYCMHIGHISPKRQLPALLYNHYNSALPCTYIDHNQFRIHYNYS